MANAYSIQRNRQGWIDPTDQDFSLKALMFKQEKYTANSAKTEAIIEKYKSLQLAREVDKDYLRDRLNGLISGVNNFGDQDYGSDALTKSINYHIGQAVDDNVMTAVEQTAKINAYQAEVQKVKEKNPELYNNLNESFGIAPAQEYMNNGEVGAKIKGSLTYTPFKDVEGEVSKFLLEIQKGAKDGVTQMPDPQNPGRMIEVTLNGKSADELRQLAMGYIGNRYDSQIKINTWGSTGGFKEIEARIAPTVAKYDSMINERNTELAEVKSKLTGRITESERSYLQDQVKSLENGIMGAQSMKESLTKDPVGALVYLEKESIAGRAGMSLGLLQTKSVEYKKDDYYFAVLEEAREGRKDEFERD